MEGSTGQNVEVNVGHALTGVRARVHDHTEAAVGKTGLARQPASRQK